MKQKNGFTLIELVVALAIMIAIAGVTLAVMNPAVQRQRAQDAVLQKAVSDIALALRNYENLKGYYPRAYDADQMTDFANYLGENANVSASGSAAVPATISFPGVITGGSIEDNIFWLTDDSDPSDPIACLQVKSVEDPENVYFIWRPPGEQVSAINISIPPNSACFDFGL